jgi:hypothetical protein
MLAGSGTAVSVAASPVVSPRKVRSDPNPTEKSTRSPALRLRVVAKD